MRRAFTLIELLVVIAVVAILAAILFPVFARARESARRTQCLSNLRQVYVAIESYRQDWDGRYPAVYNTDSAHRHGYPNLRDALTLYISDDHIWICPSDRGEIFPSDPSGWFQRTPPLYTWESMSYEWPGYYAPSPWLAGKNDAWVRRPSLAPLTNETRPWHSPPPKDADNHLTSNGLYNVIYCDGHAAAETYQVWYVQHWHHYRDQ